MEAPLSKEELTNPFKALDRIFNYGTPTELREELKTIEHHLLNKSYPHDDKQSDAYDNTVFFFEQMDRLVQAAFLAHKYYQDALNKIKQDDTSQMN